MLLGFREQVPVAIQSGLDGSVAELGLDEFGMGSLGDQERGVSVAEVMEPDLPEACPGECRFKLSPNQISILWFFRLSRG